MVSMVLDDAAEPVGQKISTTTEDWIVPTGVTSICVLCIGKGGDGSSTAGYYGAGGGALAYTNNITVTPGDTLKITPGGLAWANTTYIVYADQGRLPTFTGRPSVLVDDGGGKAASSIGSVKYSGGAAGLDSSVGGKGGGGGGAAGYAGNGGAGGEGAVSGFGNAGTNGFGGGGGGGSGGIGTADGTDVYGGCGGGGTGIFGQGSSGIGGGSNVNSAPGTGGSSGGNGEGLYSEPNTRNGGNGGLYGGGGGCGSIYSVYSGTKGVGGSGVTRIIWGPNRAFPSANTGNF